MGLEAPDSFHFTAQSGSPFLAPLLFEQVFHWSAVRSGAVVLFIFVGNLGAKSTTTFIYSRLGFRRVLAAASAGLGLSLVLLGVAATSTPVVVLALILLLNGTGRSIGATGYSTVVFSDVPGGEMRHANTLLITVQVLAGTLGIAGAAIALRLGEPIGSLFVASHDLHVTYTVAFILVACVALLSTLAALRLHPSSGDALRGDRKLAIEPPAVEPQPAGR